MNLEQSKKERAESVSKAISEVKTRFAELSQQIKEAKIPYAIVNTTLLIRTECRKFGVNEKIVREIAAWEGLKPGGPMGPMTITTEDKADAKE
jgi:hypothetical protein